MEQTTATKTPTNITTKPEEKKLPPECYYG